jgi:hypothetical protein
MHARAYDNSGPSVQVLDSSPAVGIKTTLKIRRVSRISGISRISRASRVRRDSAASRVSRVYLHSSRCVPAFTGAKVRPSENMIDISSAKRV